MLVNPKITKFSANEFVTQEQVDAMAPERIEDGFYLADDYGLTINQVVKKWKLLGNHV